MKRNLTELEKDYVDANMAIYIGFKVKSRFSFSDIGRAVHKLALKHPFLRSVIHDEVFSEKSAFDLHLYLEQVETIPRDESLFSIVLDFSESLFKVIYSPGENEETDFILILHHAIADVSSGILVIEDFVTWLYMPDLPVKSLPVPLPIEEFFNEMPSQQKSREFANRLHEYLQIHQSIALPVDHPEVSYDALIARMKYYEIKGQDLQILLDFARKENVSFNSLITAIFIKTLNLEGNLCIGAAIDLRKRLKHEIPESLITAPVGGFIFLPVKSSDQIQDLARNYQAMLFSHINSGDLLLQHYSILRGQLNPMEFKPSFFLSNAGTASFSNKVSDKITDLFFCAKAMMNCPYIACITHGGKMTMTVTFPEPWIFSLRVDRLMSWNSVRKNGLHN